MQYLGLVALDLARDRAREHEAAAARSRLAREAGKFRSSPERPRRPSVRAMLAGPVRAFGDVAHSLSHAACVAASRIEGRTA